MPLVLPGSTPFTGKPEEFDNHVARQCGWIASAATDHGFRVEPQPMSIERFSRQR
jgi:hypothetical protein